MEAEELTMLIAIFFGEVIIIYNTFRMVWDLRSISAYNRDLHEILLQPKEEPGKIKPKSMTECAPDKHKWIKDKEGKFYCEKCGRRWI